MDERIARVQQLLREIHHIAVATVNADGSPHNTPVFASFDEKMCSVWSSHPESLHSTNIAATGKVFLTLFDSREGSGGLYIDATAQLIESGSDFQYALHSYNKARASIDRPLIKSANFQGESPQRLYMARPRRIWINTCVRNLQGLVVRDTRHEVPLEVLIPAL